MKFVLQGQESERLKYRLLEPSDFETWLKLFDGTNVAQFLGMAHLPTPEQQCQLWFDLQKNRYQNDLGGMNVLVSKETGKIVGQCGLLIQDVNGQREMEIGYSILPEYWRMGYASEAAQKCRDFAFENSYTESIISIIHIDNSNSEKVAIRNGMKQDSETIYKDMPVNIFRITNKKWLQLKAKPASSSQYIHPEKTRRLPG